MTFIDLQEQARLAALLHYHVLDTPFEKQFDDLVKLASQICETPIALISLLDHDRQWFKARIGIDATHTPRDISACQYAILEPQVMIVPDTLEDERFITNPLVTGDPHMRFYAGAPLTTPSGHRIGTLCVLDIKPRELRDDQKAALEMLSNQVVTLLELRLALFEKEENERLLAQSQRETLEAIERLNLALDSGAVLGTWIWDVPEDRVTGDERFARTFGLSTKQMKTGVSLATAFSSIHPQDTIRLGELIDTALTSGGPFQAQYRVKKLNGGWLWIEASGRVEMDVDGKALRFPGVLIDIDERKHIELAYEQTSERYRLLFESIDEGFCIIEMVYDSDGKPIDYVFLEVNPAFEAQTGLTGVINRNIRDIYSSHEDHWFEAYGQVARTGEPLRFTNRADALGRWFDVYAFRIGGEDSNRVAVIFSNISERKKSEIALQESEAHLNLMVESAQDYAIISTTETGIITSWNTGAERIFGYHPDQAIGQPIDLIFTPEDRKIGAPNYEMNTAAQNGRAMDERWHERLNGERFYASGTLAAMYDEAGDVTGFVKIARDMTAQQRSQEALLEARNAAEAANIAKTEFLANMSHEIRTPMNAIIGLANILAISKPLSDKQQQFVKTLQMSADSLLGLINDLLDIAKIEARTVDLEQIPFSITRLVQEIISMMTVRVKEKGLTLTVESQCDLERMYIGDPTRMRQVILNLCSNAIKFTEKGGVHIAIDCAPGPIPGSEQVSICVSDTGIGIAVDKCETIFEKFVQADTSINRKYGGTGLGLAITKTITQIMGGTIAIDSTPGVGSRFTIRIPMTLATPDDLRLSEGSLETMATQTIERKIKPRILLVEDYAPNVLVATTVLEEFGYVIEVAGNGHDAVAMVKDGQYVAALMDVQMHGMNGFEATQAIRAYEEAYGLPRLPIIGMTAHALAGDRERCISAGMDDYVSKPFNPDALRAKLETIIEVAF